MVLDIIPFSSLTTLIVNTQYTTLSTLHSVHYTQYTTLIIKDRQLRNLCRTKYFVHLRAVACTVKVFYDRNDSGQRYNK